MKTKQLNTIKTVNRESVGAVQMLVVEAFEGIETLQKVSKDRDNRQLLDDARENLLQILANLQDIVGE